MKISQSNISFLEAQCGRVKAFCAKVFALVFFILISSMSFANKAVTSLGVNAVTEGTPIRMVADHIKGSFGSITLLMTGGSYLIGLAFFISSILKFKQHKENPTQITVGTPS